MLLSTGVRRRRARVTGGNSRRGPGVILRSAVSLAAILTLALPDPTPVQAQSGRATLNGWVAFEGVAYVDPQPRATVELRAEPPDTGVVYSTRTDAHGFFSFTGIGLGEFILRVSAPRFRDYTAQVYLPSDFLGNWALLLKAAGPESRH